MELRIQLVQMSSRVDKLEKSACVAKVVNFLSLSASAFALLLSFLFYLKKGS